LWNPKRVLRAESEGGPGLFGQNEQAKQVRQPVAGLVVLAAFVRLMAFGALEGAAAPATFVDAEALEQFGQEPLDARSIAACL
jgi:hypothetical protein